MNPYTLDFSSHKNDIIDRIAVLVENGLVNRLKNNEKEDSVVTEYNQLCSRLMILFKSCVI